LYNFELTYVGKPDKNFWMKIIDEEKRESGSGYNSHTISGWLKYFFLYSYDG